MLAHFKPFGALHPLVPKNETFETVFKRYSLTEFAQTVITNWDATNECEDARDAERMKKAAQITKESQALTNSLFLHDFSDPVVDASTENAPSSKTDFIVNQRLLLLQQSNWFKTPDYQLLQSFPELPHVTDMLMKQWKTDLKFQETASIQKI